MGNFDPSPDGSGSVEWDQGGIGMGIVSDDPKFNYKHLFVSQVKVPNVCLDFNLTLVSFFTYRVGSGATLYHLI